MQTCMYVGLYGALLVLSIYLASKRALHCTYRRPGQGRDACRRLHAAANARLTQANVCEHVLTPARLQLQENYLISASSLQRC